MKHIFLLLLKLYRKFISPLFPPCCKYYPTCSTYAVKAFTKHGAVKGLILSVWRLIRCNPWSLGGVDHVPDEFTWSYFIKKGK
ncbi:MAG: membrane protein insertion efficiency factor YidD [Oscillospiraceae bacterium]|nr:membrane protein insertion efficiency factor YidD [Oscillospiraceae bacterium]